MEEDFFLLEWPFDPFLSWRWPFCLFTLPIAADASQLF